jgi:hypothetical protein
MKITLNNYLAYLNIIMSIVRTMNRAHVIELGENVMHDPFKYSDPGLIGPGIDIIPITPNAVGSDLTDPETGDMYIAKALWCKTAGDASIVTIRGCTRLVYLLAGPNPIGAKRVMSFTGTGLCGII